ncbi:hypothetical protein L1987_27396 [Smallanthus sonchifolius]|uniref:Uncharacterized protein n=1 Tax=Smallanthus sonchifolius TaxID=185202 RepID=A0ACB9IB88_9ASTR|nr:hypothetical protein L1987_27396 [Smallanthus sonchifolius]
MTKWTMTEVEGILPPPCREAKNADGQIPQELFLENHKDLALRGRNWINETLNQSMVVSTLVFSIGFSVVFQVPGGFSQSKGFPIFLSNKYFVAFIVVDSFFVIFSATSILVFLSIILSHRKEVLLPRWMGGQLLLLSSILATLLAFCSQFSRSI